MLFGFAMFVMALGGIGIAVAAMADATVGEDSRWVTPPGGYVFPNAVAEQNNRSSGPGFLVIEESLNDELTEMLFGPPNRFIGGGFAIGGSWPAFIGGGGGGSTFHPGVGGGVSGFGGSGRFTAVPGGSRIIHNVGGPFGLIQEDEHGSLHRYPGFPESELFVEVENATIENGERRRFRLRVPPHMRTAHEAVAWTFHMTPEEYVLAAAA